MKSIPARRTHGHVCKVTMTRSEAIAANIARHIVRNKSRKRWSGLHAQAIEEELLMNTRNTSCTTTGLAVGDTEAARTATQNSAMANAASEGRKPLPGEPREDSIRSGMSVGGSQLPTPKTVQTDYKDLVRGIDYRKKGAPVDPLKGNDRDPRAQMAGQRNSKFYNENGENFKSTPTGLDSDAGN